MGVPTAIRHDRRLAENQGTDGAGILRHSAIGSGLDREAGL